MTCALLSPSLETLPNELFYRLLGFLDTETILFSFARVCRRFRLIAQGHQAFRLNFKSISKRLFHSICQQIQSEQILSLILSNDNQTPEQIPHFLRHFQSASFTQLRSLVLVEIEEVHFHQLFQRALPISSLSLTFLKNRLTDAKTLPLIISIVAQNSLRHLSLSLSWDQIDDLDWPDTCHLQSLAISNRLSFHQLSQILRHSSHLKTIVLQDCAVDNMKDPSELYSNQLYYPQLKSLTLDDCVLDMNGCKTLFRLTPALEYLHLVGGTNLNDASRWEQFIQAHLVHLKKFEFAFSGEFDVAVDEPIDIERSILPFQTPFWIETKKWFVILYYFKDSSNYSLYSLPICKKNVRFHPEKDKIFATTYANFYRDETMTGQIYEMQLNLTNLMAAADANDGEVMPIHLHFNRMEKLAISIDDEWPVGSVEFLARLINLANLQSLSISIDFDTQSESNKLTNIKTLFSLAHNVRSLILDRPSASSETICLVVPEHVRHLQVCVQSVDQTKPIIEQLKHLSSATFEIFRDIKALSTEFLTWLMVTRPNSAYRIDQMFVCFWFE